MTCIVYAMYGSNEWIVRRISTGRLESITGVPTRLINGSGLVCRTPGAVFQAETKQLIAANRPVFDLEPVADRTARRFIQTVAGSAGGRTSD
jgi:hypothetical protein